jgi:asparagine synthase (glutamine-hydrolysing)
MCGIAGVYASDVSHGMLESMTDCLQHRGPDHAGTYIEGDVGLAHTRLSIIDLTTGQQPLFNEDETVAVVFNGEIYNYRSLREDLEARGHAFSTETDTEVLVHLYEEHGTDFVDELEGMFAFGLWDQTAERLLLVRDRFGIKPLLVADDGTRVAFASELPALLGNTIDHGGLDERSIAQYFSLGRIPAPRTAFRNVRKLQPGEMAVVTEDGIERSKYYTPSTAPVNVPFTTAVRELRTRLEDAIEKRLMSDVPLGAFLSGGIDSSIVVGTMASLADEPVSTFTVGFDDAVFNESWAAREVAEYHGTDHTEYTVTPDRVREVIPTVLDRLGEPFADQSLIPTYIVARETSRDVTVALSGDGADELFAGYNRYRGEYFSEYYRRLPSAIRSGVIEPAVGQLSATRESERGETIRKVQKFLRGGTDAVPDRHFEWARIIDDDAACAFDTVDPVTAGREVMRQHHESTTSALELRPGDEMSQIQAVDTCHGLPDQILHKTDLASMYNSLEVRVPFLDRRLVEYAMSLPASYKITAREQKRVLKRAFEDVLPPAILTREKQGFDMPIGRWFRNELATDFVETMRALETDMVDTRQVRQLFDEHRTGSAERGKFLWAAYIFGRWHNRMCREGII